MAYNRFYNRGDDHMTTITILKFATSPIIILCIVGIIFIKAKYPCKYKKIYKRLAIGIIATLFLSLVTLVVWGVLFPPLTMNNVYYEPNFTGVVEEVFDKAIIVSVDKIEDELIISDKVSVSLNVKLKDSRTDFDIGDRVKVFYDGVITETYRAEINTVYAILIVNDKYDLKLMSIVFSAEY